MARMSILSKLTWASVLRFVLGYLVGCVVAAALMVGQVMWLVTERSDWPSFWGGIGAIMIIGLCFVSFIALPGYLLLRAVAYRLQLNDLWSFTFLGALNAALIVVFILVLDLRDRAGTDDPFQGLVFAFAYGLAIAGAFAGAAIWFFERWYSGKTETKVQAT